MCLIAIAWKLNPDYPLIIAANRDEFYARPSSAIHQWEDKPAIFGGRDLKAQGSWLAISTKKHGKGRFAAVTNVREVPMLSAPKSRGDIVSDFLSSELSANDFANNLDKNQYAPFNALLIADGELVYTSNRAETLTLEAGIYGLSNASLDTPWPKLKQIKEDFTQAIETLPDEKPFWQLLRNGNKANDSSLPETGVGLEMERFLSSIFIASDDYGTCCSSVLIANKSGQLTFKEQLFTACGKDAGLKEHVLPFSL